MWLARNGEEPAEENEVSERSFKLTLAVVGDAAAVGQRERYVRFGIVLPFLMLWPGTADETVDHFFGILVFFTCVGIFIDIQFLSVSLRRCCTVRLRHPAGNGDLWP